MKIIVEPVYGYHSLDNAGWTCRWKKSWKSKLLLLFQCGLINWNDVTESRLARRTVFFDLFDSFGKIADLKTYCLRWGGRKERNELVLVNYWLCGCVSYCSVSPVTAGPHTVPAWHHYSAVWAGGPCQCSLLPLWHAELEIKLFPPPPAGPGGCCSGLQFANCWPGPALPVVGSAYGNTASNHHCIALQ